MCVCVCVCVCMCVGEWVDGWVNERAGQKDTIRKTNNTNLVLEILSFFTFKLLSSLITERSQYFFGKYGFFDNFMCKMFAAQL